MHESTSACRYRPTANLTGRLTKAGPMSEAIALGLAYVWRFDLVRSGVPAVRRFGFNYSSE